MFGCIDQRIQADWCRNNKHKEGSLYRALLCAEVDGERHGADEEDHDYAEHVLGYVYLLHIGATESGCIW